MRQGTRRRHFQGLVLVSLWGMQTAKKSFSKVGSQRRSQELATSSIDRRSLKAKPFSTFLGFLTVWDFRDPLDQSVMVLPLTVARCLSTSRARAPNHSHGP